MAKVLTSPSIDATTARPRAGSGAATPTTWREGLPTLAAASLVLREPVAGDAMALLTALPDGALTHVTPAPPSATVGGYAGFIEQLQQGRRAGTLACWAMVPAETGVAVGLIGVRALDHGGTMVEGFCVTAEEFRGTTLFQTAGRLVLGCLFGRMGVHRAEFRIDVRNGRANGALRKLGATQEGLLRLSRTHDGGFHDQVLWAIVASDWSDVRTVRTSSVH